MSNISDFIIEDGVLTSYNGPGGDVVIPDGVTEIGNYAFSGCRSLTSVTIPNSVTRIGDGAFSSCWFLESVTILGRIANLGEDIFGRDDEYDEYVPGDECVSLEVLKTEYWLKGLRLPKSSYPHMVIYCAKEEIKAIPVYYRFRAALGFASYGNLDLTSEITKSYFEYLKNNAGKLVDKIFEHPELLKFMCEHTLIPAKEYDAYMAKAEKSKNVELKAMLLGYQAKLGTNTLEKTREESQKAQSDYAEAWANRMANRDPAKGIEGLRFAVSGALQKWAKWNNGTDEQSDPKYAVPKYLESCGAKFDKQVTMNTDYLVATKPNAKSNNVIKAKEYGIPIISEDDFNEMVCRYYKDAETILIPAWVKKIPDYAFAGCRSLKSIEIPDSVQSVGVGAFKGCKGLADKNGFVIVNGILYDYFGNSQEITIPANVNCISDKAFYECKKLENVVIPEGVLQIGREAFFKCENLKSVTFPKSLKKIGRYTFELYNNNFTVNAVKNSYAAKYFEKRNQDPACQKMIIYI